MVVVAMGVVGDMAAAYFLTHITSSHRVGVEGDVRKV